MLFTSLLLSLCLNISPNNLGPDMVFQNNFNFIYRCSLPSITALDTNGKPFLIDNSISIEGLLQFNSGTDISLRFDKWFLSCSYYECTYDGLVNQWNYELVDGFNHELEYFIYSGIYYDSEDFSSLTNLEINYWVSYDDGDIYHSLQYWSGDELESTESFTLGQEYSLQYISSGLSIKFSVDTLSKQVKDFVNFVSDGGFDYENGYRDGYEDGKGVGYGDGYVAGVSTDSTVFTIFNGILNVALIPVNFFLAIFNFEILGINVASFVSALLSVCVVIIVCRVVLNGGTGAGDSKE